MAAGLVTTLFAVTLALGVFGLVEAARDRPPDLILLGAAAVVELVLLAQVVVAVAAMVAGERPAETGTFIGYLAGGLLVLPVAGLWAVAERTRWSSVVVAVAGLALAVMVLRMQILWEATGG